MLLDHLDELYNRDKRQALPLASVGVQLTKLPESYSKPKRGFIFFLTHPFDLIGWDHYHQYMRDARDLTEVERYQDALGAYYLALKERPSSIEPLMGMVQALETLGGSSNYLLALEQAKKALALNFRDLTIYDELVYLFEKLGSRQEALEYRRKRFTVRTLKSNPNNPMVLNNIGVMLVDLKMHAQAIHYFQKALIESPHLSITCFNLAKAWLQKGMETEKKKLKLQHLQAAEDALNEIRDDTPAILILRGKILYQAGKYAQAKEVMEQALYRAPSLLEIHTTLQLINEKLGNIKEAIDNYETYRLLQQEDKPKKKRRFSFLSREKK